MERVGRASTSQVLSAGAKRTDSRFTQVWRRGTRRLLYRTCPIPHRSNIDSGTLDPGVRECGCNSAGEQPGECCTAVSQDYPPVANQRRICHPVEKPRRVTITDIESGGHAIEVKAFIGGLARVSWVRVNSMPDNRQVLALRCYWDADAAEADTVTHQIKPIGDLPSRPMVNERT